MQNNDLKKFYEDVKDLIKSIGTSSSINEERDERSVENYVRTGGNTMENTTEPDPEGDIAVTKAYPDATSDSKNVIGSATNPNGDIAVTDAPEGPTPTQETIPSGADAAVAPSKTDEVNTPDKVTIAKGEKCPTCDSIVKGDDADSDDAIEIAAEKEAEEPADEKAEMKKSIWGGAFAPRK